MPGHMSNMHEAARELLQENISVWLSRRERLGNQQGSGTGVQEINSC